MKPFASERSNKKKYKIDQKIITDAMHLEKFEEKTLDTERKNRNYELISFSNTRWKATTIIIIRLLVFLY